MKSTTLKILRTGALAAGLALSVQLAPAATFNYNEMDLILGFSSPSAANEYVINLGQIGSLTAGPLSLGNLNTDLTSVFGANWYNRGDLYWGAFAAYYDTTTGTDPQYTLYVSHRAELGALTRASQSQQAIRASSVDAVGNQLNGKTTTANSSVAVIEDKATINGYTSKQNGTHSQSLGAYSFAEDTFSNGTANATLNLYKLQPGSGSGVNVGQISISDSGQIVTTVPEPSTWAMLGVSAVGLLVSTFRRRKLA